VTPSPAPAPVAHAPAPVPAPAPAPVAVAAPVPVAAPAPAAPAPAPTSMIPVSIAPGPIGTTPAMDATTAELMRLASSPVGDDMMGGEFDGSRRGRRLRWIFGTLIFLVIGGAIASILISQSMNSHG